MGEEQDMDKTYKLHIGLLIAVLLAFLILPSVSALELNPFADVKNVEKAITLDMSNFIKADFNSQYGVIRLSKTFFWFETDKIAEYSLTKNTEQCLIDCEAEGKASLYYDGQLFEDTIFKTTYGQEINVKAQYYLKGSEEYVEETPVYKEVCKDVFDPKNSTTTKSCTNELVETLKETKTRDVWNAYNGEILKAGNYEWKLEGKKHPAQTVDFIPIKSEKEFSEWAWWSGSWSYKKDITLKNVAGSITNLTKYLEVSYDAKFQADWDDLRFVVSDTTELPYDFDWKNSTKAGIWIRVASLSAGDNNISMYYGNAEASAGNNSATTFAGIRNVVHFNGLTNLGTNDAFASTGTITYRTTNLMNSSGSVDADASGWDSNSGDLQLQNKNYVSTVFATPDGTDLQAFLGWTLGGSYGDGCYFSTTYCGAGLRLCCGDSSSGGWSGWQSCGTVIAGQTYMATISHNATKTYCYLNGVLGPSYGGNADYQRQVRLGYREASTGAHRLHGNMTDYQFYYDTTYGNDVNYIKELYQNSNSSSFILGSEQTGNSLAVVLNSPATAYNTSNPSITFNCSATDETGVLNLTLIINNADNYTITGGAGQNLSLQVSRTLAQGNGNWTCRASDGSGSGDPQTASIRTFTVDSVNPTIYGLNNITNITTLSMPINSTHLFNVTDAHLGSCGYWTSDNSTNTTITCNSSFNILWNIGGSKTIYAWVNDTFGNINSTTGSFNIYDFNVTQSGEATAGEGSSQTFTLLINSTSFPIGDADADFVYGGAGLEYTTKTAIGSNVYYFTKTFTIPTGTGNSTGKDVAWWWSYNTTQLSIRTTDPQNQTVYNVSITDCAVTEGRVILNMSLKDEELNSLVNITTPNTAVIEIDMDVTSLSNSSQIWSFSKKWESNNTVSVCVPNGLLNDTSYRIDFTVGYDATGKVREFYYMDNGTLDNTVNFNSYTDNTIDLMDLANADSTTFLFSFTGADGLEIDDALVHTFKKYIGEGLFREIERSKQDNNGQTHVHLVEEDVIYYFMVTQYSNIIFTSDQYNAKCLSTPCEITLSASATDTDWSIIDNEGGKYAVTSDKSTRIVTLDFDLDASSLVNMSLYKYNGANATFINGSSLTAMAGSIPLHVPIVYGNDTFFAVIYNNNTFVKSAWIDLTESGKDYFGTTGAILSGLVVLSMMLMAVSEGVGFIIFTVLALIVVTAMKLVNLNTLALISIICAGGIIMWKLVNRRNKPN